MTESTSSLMCALDTTHRPGPARTASYSESVISMGVRQRSSPHSKNTCMGESMAPSSANCLISSTTPSLPRGEACGSAAHARVRSRSPFQCESAVAAPQPI
jgi:hypothetical protein